MQHIDTAYWLGLVVSVVLPILVGVVTTHVTDPGIQATLLLAFTAVNGFIVEYAGPHPDGYSVKAAVVLWIISFATSVASHFGLWQPTKVAELVQRNVGLTKKDVHLTA